ncbi:MAG: efflux RND transporter periplasmic adaptor subunit [Gammaproteobacteria bacterium]|nr:efflux RND transporter periplasmic adaptor subunit [Gammaproteobacteria bacterium]
MSWKVMKGCTAILLAATIALSVTACARNGDAAQMAENEQAVAQKPDSEEAGHEKDQAGKEASEGKTAEGHDEEGVLKITEEEAKTAGVRVEKIELRNQAEQITVTANILPDQDRLAHIQPRMTGRIVSVEANLGNQVVKEQTLAMLDSVELNEAGAAYLQSQSTLTLAKANFNRAQKLFKDKIIPQKDFLSARTELEKARAAQRAAVSKLTLFGVNPAKIGSNSAALTFPVQSPFAGTVIEKNAVLGDIAEPGKSLFTIADLSTVWIETNVFEKDLSKVQEGLPAAVSVAAYPKETFQGRVTYIGSMVNQETRTVNARVEVANADGRLKPGMFANVAIETGVGQPALSVPDDAVVLMQGQPTVFIAEHGGFEPRPVQTGERMGGRVILQSGVADGETVVTSGAYALKARILKSQIGEGH